jgi:putative ATP-dependent endonuclease of OLD family
MEKTIQILIYIHAAFGGFALLAGFVSIIAKESYSKNIIADVIEYRMNKNAKDNDKIDFTLLKEIISNYRINKATIDEVIVEIKNIILADQILIFIEKVK